MKRKFSASTSPNTGRIIKGRGTVTALSSLASAVLAATLIANPASASVNTTKTVTLNFWGTESASYYGPAIAKYEHLNPGIKVVYHVFPFDDLDTVISTHMETHDGSYAVYEVDEPRTEEFASRGWLVPMNASTVAQLKKTVPAEQLGEVSWNSSVWSLPLTTSTQLLFYNKALLTQAHVPFPGIKVSQGLTWQQLYAEALKVHKSTGKAGLLFDQVNRIYQLQPLPQGLGGGPGVTGPNGLTANVDNAAWVKSMKWYQTCFTSGVTPKSINASETESYFASGQAGFFWGGPWNYYPFLSSKAITKDGMGVAPTPHWAGHATVVPTDSWSVGVNPYSPLRAQGMAFAKWLALTPTGTITLMEHSGNGSVIGAGAKPAPGNPPASLLALGKYWELWPSAVANLMKYQIYNQSIHRAHTLGWVQYETVIESAFLSIADGSNVQAVLNNAQSQLTSDFSAVKP